MIQRSVYIAAPFALRLDAYSFMRRIQSLNWHVTSTWITEDVDNTLTPERAQRDLEQVAHSEILVKLPNTFWKKSTGGKFVEMGYALGLGIRVAVIGSVESIFDLHPRVKPYRIEEDFLEQLKSEQ